MTHVTQALDAVDALTGQLQELVQDGRFVPRFFDLLFGLRTALGNARDRFAAGYGGEASELPIFARVFDRCVQASAIGAALIPDDAAMSHYGASVQRAVAAFEGDRPATARPALRGALRVRSASVAGVRGGRPPAAMPEPYYTSLVKLFPVEAVTLYPLAIGIAGDSGVLRLVLIGIITLFVITLRWFGTQEESGGAADGPAIAVSVISFALYAGALGGFGYLPGGPEQTRQFLAFITIMWVALVPFALRRARR